MTTSAIVLLTISLAAGETHQQTNAIYRELREVGVPVGAMIKVPLPAPTMADGLDARAQKAVLQAVAGDDYPVEELLRPSFVSPQVFRLRDVHPSDPQAPAHTMDVWFVAYGDLRTVAAKDFRERLLKAKQGEGKAQELKPADLTRRSITPPKDVKHESFGHIEFHFLDRVEIAVTGHSFWSQTADSILIASKIDSRFRDDAEFPNRWRPLRRDADGKFQPGPPQPYDGAGYYIKVTRLAEPRGALFFEAHLVFTEPLKWFNGANLLRSKLPLVVQDQVRTTRRELKKASR